MTVKILFFDTSALLKLFIDELGSDTVKWLTSNNVKVGNSLHFVVNDQVCIEFERKKTDFLKDGRISVAKSHVIIDKFNRHYKNKVFRVIGQEIILAHGANCVTPQIISRENAYLSTAIN